MSPRPVDLRSDTVTRPTPAMREAMARAEVGDDVYGEDPTARTLEERVAELLGKEAALFVPTGTMGNQIGLMLHTRPGDEALAAAGCHVEGHESGAAAALSGVQIRHVSPGWNFDAEELLAASRPDHYTLPRTRLVVVENTHNAGGGRVWPEEQLRRVAYAARSLGYALHLDGARLWNAGVASRCSVAALAAPFDTASVCFSKGLGAPVGSALAARRDLIDEARRIRKRHGGGMRQAGVLAAAALHALEHHRERLVDDHDNARTLARAVARSPGAILDVAAVETNIVSIGLRGPFARRVVVEAAKEQVLVHATARDRLRAVTHLDVAAADVLRAGDVLARAIERAAAP
jgi:threonine aldolase